MQRDTKKNYQLYGRNDMIMLDEHNKIYGSLGLAEPYIVATKEGETLLLDGAKDNEPFIGLSIYGKSHQKTVAGNQLLDVSSFPDNAINKGIRITNNHDGSFTVSGTKTETGGVNLTGGKLTLPAGTYTLSGNTNGLYVALAYDGGYMQNNVTMTFESETEFQMYIQANETQDETITIFPMLNAGTTALPWEPYTGGQLSPNPDYPQEIESVGDDGDIGVDVYGGNFLTDVTDKVISGDVGDTVNDVKAIWNVVLDKNLLDKELIFSFDSDSNMGMDFSCQTNIIVDNLGKWSRETRKQITKGRNYFSVAKLFDEIPEGNVSNFFVQLRIRNEPTEAIQFTVSNPMLNIGSTALPFEPYKQPQSLIVSTPNGLPGIPVSSGGNYTDESGQQWISDEVDYRRGKYVQRVRVLNAREERWADDWNSVFPDESGNTHVFNSIISNKFRGENAFCTHFRFGDFNNPDNGYDLFSTVKGGGDIGVRASSELASTIEEWNQFIQQNDVIFACALQTPIETDLTPEQITAYQSLHTNYPTTTVMNDERAGMKAIYKQIENGG